MFGKAEQVRLAAGEDSGEDGLVIALGEIVDTDRYPLDGANEQGRRELIERCRAELASVGAAVLEGFVKPAAVARIVDEVAPLETLAFHKVKQHNVYLEPDDLSFPDDHPRNAKVTTTSATLGNHHLQDATVLQSLYAADEFKSFVADALGYPKLYPYEDPVSGVNVLYYPPGATLGWHFDNASFTTTVMIREAQAGAAFEYVPFLRSDTDPAHDAIGRLLDGGRDGVKQLFQTDGTLVLFTGSRTVHRVTPVEGATTRLLATLTFSPEPGARLAPINQKTFYDYDAPGADDAL